MADRYDDLGPIGLGGMAEVRRARDHSLKRVVAIKAVRPELQDDPRVLARFVEEAQATAQLEHPGIVPVHELGTLPDGRPYFTMREVHGRTLRAVIDEVHAASRERWEPGVTGWTFRRLIDAFHAVCEAVAYAHDRGVVHRDLKPDNVMVGPFGEVLVLDWGLAKVGGATDELARGVTTDRFEQGAHSTRMGAVAGTPAYMAPEQARGEVDRITPRTDVYALGAILYDILSGRPPYEGADGRAVVAQVRAGPPPPPGPRGGTAATLGFDWELPVAAPPAGPPLPDALLALCTDAMQRDAAHRPADARELAAGVTAWLDGARAREQALALVEQAEACGPDARTARLEAEALRSRAVAALAGIPSWEPEERKAGAWALEDEADRKELEAERHDVRARQLLSAALTLSPDLPEAHRALLERDLADHAAAEAARDVRAASRAEAWVTRRAAALPAQDPMRATAVAWLRGDGALSLTTDPPGARATLYRYELAGRRLVLGAARSLGPTPLRSVVLPFGSWLVVLEAPGCHPVRYPVSIGRGEHWDGVPPDASEAAPVRLPREGELGPEDVYVPGGWFASGGDLEGALPKRRLWADTVVFRRFHVTNREYIRFLDDLVARGEEAAALRYVPRERAGSESELGPILYGRDGGRFVLRPDADGDVWLPDYPVLWIDWPSAMAYAAWEAERTGLAWRLPAELEWEKAARGVDGRLYPWGDFLDPSWACVRGSMQGRQLPQPVDSFPVDQSPYGLRGAAGNVREWCLDPFERDGHVAGRRVIVPDPVSDPVPRVERGGFWMGTARYALVEHRISYVPSARFASLSFRLARSG